MARTVAHMYVDTEEMENADRWGAWDPAITGQLVIQESPLSVVKEENQNQAKSILD